MPMPESKSERYQKMKPHLREWDRENMRTLSCRVRTYEAEAFKDYCTSRNTTPGNLLKEYVFGCIETYGKELEEARNNEDEKGDKDGR